ncbi:MAG: hypothetical protein ACE37F_13575 [Nannocystaceae bacterium]|nr:hypothetical protein [bacterium]
MDRETLGNVLFLGSLLTVGCASGSEGQGPRPGPFVTGGGDDGGSGDPWTDPLETTGQPGTSGSDSDDGWPSEGETGVVSGSTGDMPPGPDGDTGMGGSTGGVPGGEESGGYGDGTTGYMSPPVGEDPCPALAQRYADCNPDYIYEYEIELCTQARQSAADESPACGAAHAEYLACLSTLDCASLLAPGVPFACVLQAAAMDLACL